MEYFAPIRARYAELRENPSILDDTLAKGRERAKAAAEAKMRAVREAIGVA
jgi:hypothetical protein